MRDFGLSAQARVRRLLCPLRGRSGQTIAETALVLPAFFLLLVGSIQYSILLFTYCNATYACRTAARYASVRSSSSLSPATVAQVKSVVTSSLFMNSAITPSIGVSYYTPALTTGTNTVGNFVGVSASWTQTILIPFMSSKSLSISTQEYRIITR